jgi:hypothetical protein
MYLPQLLPAFFPSISDKLAIERINKSKPLSSVSEGVPERNFTEASLKLSAG